MNERLTRLPNSMTGYATESGEIACEGECWRWIWEIRSVNGRGLDLRLRVPDWIEGLEPEARALVGGAAARGNVTLSLRVTRAEGGPLEPGRVAGALAAVAGVERAARDAGLRLRRSTAAELLALRPSGEAETPDTAALRAAVVAGLPALLDAFAAARAAEGRALAALLSAQVDRIAALAEAARPLAEARRERAAEALRENVARLLGASEALDEARLAQELALLAVKLDVTEELDRLEAHVAAARTLLAETAPVGRRLDFLTQEFNREANTLCSKSQDIELTRLGLDLKAAVDQMREQVQNVE